MSKFDPFLTLAKMAKRQCMLMEANPDDVLRLYEQRDGLLAHVDEMTKMREAHGFDSWAAVLVELGRLKGLTRAD